MNKESGYIRLLHHEHYSAANFNYLEWIKCTMHLMDVPQYTRPGHIHDIKCSEIDRTFMFGCIIFSASTIEAFINFYAKHNNLKYVSEMEKSLSTLNKWRLYPQLVASSNIGEHILQRIHKVFYVRDRIVHPKPHNENLPKNVRIFTPCEGAFLINTINMAVKSLDNLKTPHKSADWILSDAPNELDFDTSIYI